jgi:sterol desaturase/sphingolipid hydroxylase (fatty acid hydroxylase superfamily)
MPAPFAAKDKTTTPSCLHILAILTGDKAPRSVWEKGPITMDYTEIFILACIFIPLEHLIPMEAHQRRFRREWANDVLYVLFNGFFIRAGFGVVLAGLMWAYTALAGTNPLPFVAALPIWVQVVAIIVVHDIGYYFAHRLMHKVPVLWRFHVVHHGIQEMDWLASHRVHPVEMIFTNTLSLMPIFFLSFSLEAVIIHQMIYQAQTLLLHANVRVNFGPLKWILASPEHHRWHHATDRDARDSNFAAQLSVIDWIGGTIFMPQERRPQGYGVREAVPHYYHEQLAYPFQKLAEMAAKRFGRPKAAEAEPRRDETKAV